MMGALCCSLRPQPCLQLSVWQTSHCAKALEMQKLLIVQAYPPWQRSLTGQH